MHLHFVLPALQFFGLVSAMETGPSSAIKPGKYRLISSSGGLGSDPESASLRICARSETSTVWTYSCADDGSCHLETEIGQLQLDSMTKLPILSRAGAPATVKFVLDSDGPNGKLCHIILDTDTETGVDLVLDSGSGITARPYNRSLEQEFLIKPVPDITPGNYYIRSQWGFLCADNEGDFVHCSVHGMEPQAWDLVEIGNDLFIGNYVGWLRSGPTEQHAFDVIVTKNGRSPIVLEPGSGPLDGDASFRIRLDFKHYLDADRKGPHHIQAWTSNFFSQQDFVFVPVNKTGGKKISFSRLQHNTDRFLTEAVRDFPVHENTIENLSKVIPPEELAKDAEKAEIFMDASTYELITKFLAYKKIHGNPIEKEVYAGIKNTNAFIDRLVQKRPLAFYTENEITLRMGQSGRSQDEPGADDWARVGQVDANGHSIEGRLDMEDFMTYEEMELSALINVSTATRFINNGNRNNCGARDYEVPVPGYFLTGVGARFEIPGRMEFRHMALAPGEEISQELPSDPLSKMWHEFYGITKNPGPEEYEGDYVRLHIPTYKARLSRTLRPILEQANRLGELDGRKAVLRLVGFGLGVWAIEGVDQQKHFHEVAFGLIRQHSFRHIERIEILWMGRYGDVVCCKTAVGGDIFFHFSKKNPADPVEDDELLVATYAWDGNSFPGNEYWVGLLNASGDPAAAACSTIQEMQNPFINECLTANNNLSLYA